MTQTTTALKTSIAVQHSNAPFLRVTAKQDLPEYGITSGETVYLVFSDTESKAQGKRIYHIVRWSYERTQWACPCKATIASCKHAKAASIACKAHKACVELIAAATLVAKKQATQEMLANETAEEYATRHTAWRNAWAKELAERDAVHAAKREAAPLQPQAFSILRVTPPTKKRSVSQVSAFGRS